ncbi:MAG: sigma-70 family RNA polymerase sigma factor [Coriobacteriia bacterium]
MDEIELVERARRGDERSFALLVRLHERSLFATAYAIMRSEWDAADAVQDALAEAYAKVGTLRNAGAFKAWLTRILVNRCYAVLRKRKHDVLTADPPEPEAHTYLGREEGLDLMRAVRSLDLEHREVIALRYFRDMKLTEIAEVLDCPLGTVKSRINRALGRLGSALGSNPLVEVAE